MKTILFFYVDFFYLFKQYRAASEGLLNLCLKPKHSYSVYDQFPVWNPKQLVKQTPRVVMIQQ